MDGKDTLHQGITNLPPQRGIVYVILWHTTIFSERSQTPSSPNSELCCAVV